jgi:hypothetical protein
MRRCFSILALVSLWTLFSGLSPHKFYVSMYQVNFAPEKQMLQITSRIFIDDLNNAVEGKMKQRIFLGDKRESSKDEGLMRDYLLSNIQVRVNQKPVQVEYRSKEIQEDVVVCYFRITGVSDVKSIWMRNTNLFDLEPDQQNIIQTQVRGTKKSMLLTKGTPEDQITFL